MVALAMLFLAAFSDAIPVPNPKEPVDYAAWQNERFAVPDDQNAAELLEAAADALYPNEELNQLARKPLAWPADRDADGKRWIRQNRDALTKLDKALERDRCYFAIPRGVAPADLPLRHLAPLRELAACQLLQVRFAAAEGDWQTAVAHLETSSKLCRLLEEQPNMISRLVAGAIRKGLYDWTRHVAVQPDIDVAAFSKAYRRLDRSRKSSRTATMGDVVLLMSTLQNSAVSAGQSDPETSAQLAQAHEQLIAYHKHLAKLTRSDPRQLRKSNQAQLIAKFELTEQAVDGIARFYELEVANECNRAGTRALLAVQTYYANEGRWPTSLEEARGRESKSRLKDPFSGDLLVYRKTAEGPQLYSVWVDGEDTGGKPSVSSLSDEGDFVFLPMKRD